MKKNTINRNEALLALNGYLKLSNNYNEAIIMFFENYISEWLKINPSEIPTLPQEYRFYNSDGSKRILPIENLLTEALLRK